MIRVRDADESDFEACLPLLRQLWPALPVWAAGDPGEMEALRSVFCGLVRAPRAKALVVEDEGQVVGLMDLTFRETLFSRGRAMIIEDLVVDERHRGKGLGRKLVQRAEDIAGHESCEAIELSSSLHRKETHRFWEALGYEREAYQYRKVIGGQ